MSGPVVHRLEFPAQVVVARCPGCLRAIEKSQEPVVCCGF